MDTSEIMTIKEVARYLKMNERTVYRLIQAGQIPATKLGKQWRLNKEQINEWLGFQMAELPAEELAHLEKDHKEAIIRIAPLLKQENIIFNFTAFNKNQALKTLVDNIVKNKKLAPQQGEKLLYAVIDRERLCSTAIGEGVAIPHPRQAVTAGLRRPILVLGICKKGMDLESIDGKPTQLIFLISAPRDDIHLKLMARLSRLLRDKVFRYKLVNAKDFKELKKIVEEKERTIEEGQ